MEAAVDVADDASPDSLPILRHTIYTAAGLLQPGDANHVTRSDLRPGYVGYTLQ